MGILALTGRVLKELAKPAYRVRLAGKRPQLASPERLWNACWPPLEARPGSASWAGPGKVSGEKLIPGRLARQDE